MNNTTIDIKDLLRSLIRQGIKLSVSQGKLIVEGDLLALDDDVKSLIKLNKQAIVDYVEARKKAKASVLRPRPEGAKPVLSFSQQRLWFIDQLEAGGSDQYNMPFALRLTGLLNRDALQCALNQIVVRHDVLRSVYYTLDNGEAGIRTMEAVPVTITIVDLAHLEGAEREQQVLALALSDAAQPFKLGSDLMLRASLLALDEHEHVLLFTMHHIASDGWSIGVLTQEFAALYEAFSNGMADPLPPLPVQYADFAYWQRNLLQGDILEQHLDYWLHQLADLPQVHSLPLDFARPANQRFEGDKHIHLLDKTLSNQLHALSLAHGATLFMTLQTAFAALLSRYSNETDIVMGTPIANRTQAELSTLIGFFVNVLILRSDLSGNPSFSALLQKNKQMALQAYDHQDIPFEVLVDKLRPGRSASHGALYQIMFALQNTEQSELRLPELTLSQVTTEHVIAKYDILLSMEEFADGLQATWTYCSALFSPITIERMSRHFEALLRSIVAAPETKIFNTKIFDPAERNQILVEWNGKPADHTHERAVLKDFEDRATQCPDASAVRCGDAALSYADLNRKANRLAHCLVEAGAGRGAVIGVHCARSPELMVAVLAIWKCGAAYVPFDPNSTTKRLAAIVDDAGIKLVLAQSALRATVPVAGIEVLELDGMLADAWLAEYPDTNPSAQGIEIEPDDSAYVIYTSGSTGLPKGVEITHANLVNYCNYALSRYYADGLAGSLVVTSHAFDITVPSLYLPLLRGGCVDFMPPQGELEALAARLATAEESYLLRMTPLHAQALLHLLLSNSSPAAAHVFVIGGASFPPEMARDLQIRFPNSQIFNHYGPTEATVGCAMFDVTAELDHLGKVIPIGTPMDNTVLYVLNTAMELAPLGAWGELYIGGAGLAKGYVNHPDLTAEKFIRNPFSHGRYERIYKSGDVVRWLVNGQLEYLGRCDDQVKIRGFRIELQEIEHHLRSDFRVAQAVVVARDGADGEKRLVAYIVPAEICNHDLLAAQLTAALRQELPDYMVPSSVVMLDDLPLSANGKVDKRRLPEPEFRSTKVSIPPETGTERRLAPLWSDLLKVPCDNVVASFFELGGHSLLVTRLISAVNQVFAVNLKIAEVFSHPTIRELANVIDASLPSSVVHIPQVSRSTRLPLSFAQQRLWLIDRLEGGSQYNMPFAFRLNGILNLESLQRTLDTIVARHEVLRSVYRTQDDGEAYVVVQAAHPIRMTTVDLAHLDATAQEEQVQSLAAADAARPFDLGNDLMLRVSLLALAEQQHVLLFNMHHIASDGWSMGVLTEEFAALYGAFSSGVEDPLPALPVQYADFAHWQRRWLQGEVLDQQLGYWLKQLVDLPPVHCLPLDFSRSAVQRFAGAVYPQRLDKTLSERLKAFSLEHGITQFMTLQTAFAVLLSRYSNETDIVMGTPIANRTQAELSPLIGFFVNTLVLRSDLSSNPPFSTLLQQNKQMALQAYEHQHVPFEMLVDKLQPERSFHHSPLFQIMFTLQTHEQSALTLPGLSMQALDQDQHTAKFDLTLALRENEDGLQMSWEYCTELFQASSIEGMAEAFAELLASIVAAPETPINALPIVSENAQQQLLKVLAKTNVEYSKDALVHELLEEYAATRPESIADERHYVLDRSQQLVPVGVPGELCIAGTWLERAHLNRAELTAQRFMRDPFSCDPLAHLYRTGDLVRWLPDGGIQYLGRIDSQIKIRGFRINLCEVEAKLRASAGVGEALVVARETVSDGVQLIAYLSAKAGWQISAIQLRQHLARQMPEFMVPSAFVVLEALPLTPDGKPDRQLLPMPDANSTEWHKYEAPQGEIETQLTALWHDLVSATRIGRRDNFFALGGSSLSAVRLEFSIREQFGIEVSFRELFEHAELAAQAALIATKERLAEFPTIEKVGRDGRPMALSFAQQRLWFIEQLTPGSTQYNMPLALHLKGRLDLTALQAAMDAIAARHEVLRTVYAVTESGEPYQCIRAPESVPFSIVNLREHPTESRAQRVRQLVEAEASKPFNLQQDSMLRLGVLVLGVEEHVLLLTMHHIASDGWSRNVLVEEFVTLYHALRAGDEPVLPSLPVQYADFAHWQRGWLQGDVLDRQLNYWLQQLENLPAIHSLPQDFPRRPIQDFSGAVYHQQFDRALSERLQALSVAQGTTLFMTLQTAFSTLLARYSGKTDIVMGTVIANRAHPELTSLIGFFVNTLVLRSDLSGNPSFAALLQRNKSMALQAYDHQHIPFEMLVDKLQPERSFSHSPLFQIMFTLQSNEKQPALDLPELSLQIIDPDQHTAKFDLTLVMHESEEGLRASWEYCTELFQAQTIANMADAFTELLAGIVAEPECPIQRLPLLSAVTQQRVLALGLAQPANYLQEQCLHQRFETQVQCAPETIAVVHGEQQLSYKELNQRANRVAHYLIEQGVPPDSPVGICVERSIDMVVGMLGILKAGCAYVPLEPSYPESRLAYILVDAGIDIVLTQCAFAERLSLPGKILQPLDDSSKFASYPDWDPAVPGISAHSLAVISYVSDSSGKPRGAMLEHRSIFGLVSDPNFMALNVDTVFLQLSSIACDAAILETWGSLLNGGRLVCFPKEHCDSWLLTQQIQLHGVNSMFLTPFLFDEWSRQPGNCPSLHWLLTGGDVVNPESLARVYQKHRDLNVVHVFGPTENAVLVTCRAMPKERSPDCKLTLGPVVQGSRVYVLSADGALQPPGAAGELHIAGQGLSRGYRNQATLTADRFVTDPFVADTSARMYRSGDQVRWSVDGQLEFLGRIDKRVNLDGLRIELGEIETVLGAHALIQQAAVTAIGEPKQLVAYVVAKAECSLDDVALQTELRNHLSELLPKFMIPSDIVALSSMPLTASGELDPRALPEPDGSSRLKAAFQAPEGELETALAALWIDLLGVSRVGRRDNFFALGGSSLSTVRLEFAIQERFGIDVSLRELFEHSELTVQARLIATKERLATLPPIQATARNDQPLALSFAQQRLWFIDQLTQGGTQYNMPVALRLEGDLHANALHKAFSEIVRRHEVLRSVYVTSYNGEASQTVLSVDTLPLTRFDLSGQPEAQQVREVLRLAEADAITPYRLDRDLMLRITLITLNPHSHVLLLNMHHIASDGWSMGVLFEEFVHLYTAFTHEQSNPLPTLTIQYADFAVWQRSHIQGEFLAEQLNYWQQQLAGIPPVHSLRLDKPRPLQPSFIGKSHSVSLDPLLAQRLSELGQVNGATLFMVLHAAFAVLLGRWSREDDVVVGTPIAGRTRKELAPLVGFFVNNLVLRSRLNGKQSFEEFLQVSRNAVLAAYEHQEVPFEMLVDRFCPERNLNHSPLFQILFSLQNQAPMDVVLPGLTISAVAREQTVAKFDLSVQVGQDVEGYVVEWNYSTDVFEAETINSLAEHYLLLLQAIVASPRQNLDQLPLLTEGDQRFYAAQEARVVKTPPPIVCLHQLFEQQAARWPDNTALIHEGARLSYRELNAQSNQLAAYLRTLGVQTGDLIGLFVERSLDMVVSILGILKSGAAYVPMDPHNPAARTQHMVDDAGVSWIISHRHLQSQLPTITARVLHLDAPEHVLGIYQCSASDLSVAATGVTNAHAAYVIYTSGSTGKPKGVVVEHRHVVRLFDSSAQHFRFDQNDCWTLFHSYAFDFSVWEIWGALLFGGRLIVVPYEISRSAPDFYQLLKQQRVTVLNQTPSAFYLLIEQVKQAADLSDLRYVVFGGEALDPPRLRPWLAHFGDENPQLVNMYGITETTVHVTYRRIHATDTSSPSSVIGVPLSDLQCHVCNEAMSLQPIGVPGELFVGGGGVSRGYLNRPELSRERFIDNPFDDTSGRLYRTGDLVRWTAEGELEYLGRIDHQTKLRGFRIELGEIEHELLNSNSVKECVVLIHGERGGEQQLIAYIVPNSDTTNLPNLLRKQLLTVLPQYMVPSAFIVLERIPLTDNGKINRRALFSMTERRVAQAEYAAPTTPLEKQLCDVWSDVMSVERVGVHDNFFSVGGDSIRVVQIVRRARIVGIDLDVKDIFLNQTVAELAELHLRRGSRACADPAPLHLLTREFDSLPYIDETVEDCYPVTSMQQRMLEQHGPFGWDQAVYQPRAIYDISGIELNHTLMETALRHLFNMHPVLRTRFVRTENGDHIQLVMKVVDFHLPVVDVSHLQEAAQWDAIESFIAEDGPFALGEVGIRFALLVYGHKQYGLFISAHHAIIDGWALVEMRNELTALYHELSERQPSLLTPASSNVNVFKEHVALEREAQSLDSYREVWRELLTDFRPMPELVELLTNAGNDSAADLHVDATLVRGLKFLAEQQRVTLKAPLLVAYQRALGELLRTDTVTVDVVCSGRSPRLSDPLGAIGLFWSLLPICNRLASDQDDAGAITETAKKLLAMDAHSLYPADSIRKLVGAETMSYAAFNYVNFHNAKIAIGKSSEQVTTGLNVRYASDRFAYAIKLAISGDDSSGDIVGRIEFDRRYFNAEKIQLLRNRILAQLRRLAAGAVTGDSTNSDICVEEVPEGEACE